jgi:uncharacterized iron-regulated membrane protein
LKTFRQIFFWAHLVAGLVAGLSIFIMCFTGTVLAFEHEIVEWTERDVRRVTPPAAEAVRLPLDELLKKVRELKPDARPSGIVLSPDPRDAIAFSFGRDAAIYANPYTGELREPARPNKTSDFMHLMTDWHRYLALSGDNRPVGKAINGACNLAFCFLAISGLYLWIPRTWSWRGVKAIALFNFKSTGKARDFNWHNSIGLWSALILIVLTLTAVPISYRWGGNLIIRLAGETVPVAAPGAPQGPGANAVPAIEVPRPAPGTRPLGYDALLASVQKEIPQWESISFRLGAPGGRGGAGGQRPAGTQGGTPVAPAASASATGGETPPRARAEGERRGGAGGEGRPAPQAVTVTVKEPNSWPRTATTTLSLNPFTGEVLKREGYGDLPASRQIRSWTRFLHTGQALGWMGQFVAGLACLGGCFLVYTGFALSWRRFFQKKSAKTETAKP